MKIEKMADSLFYKNSIYKKNNIEKLKLINYNYQVYNVFHKNNKIVAFFNLIVFLMHQLLIKPFFKTHKFD